MSNKMTLWQVLQSVDAGTASSATQTAVNALRAVVEKTQPFGVKCAGNSELVAIVEAAEPANMIQPVKLDEPPEPTILIGSGWVDLSRVQNIDPLDKETGKFKLLMVSGVYAWGDNAETNYDDVVSAWRAIRRRAVWGK